MTIDKSNYQILYKELVGLIESTKTKVISQANSAMTVLFWHIGKKILEK